MRNVTGTALLQTISVPYRCEERGREVVVALRRTYGAAVRTSYANAVGPDGTRRKEKELRHLVKSRFAGGVADAWLLHCATLEGMDLRKARPEGDLVFGGRANLERRGKGLIDRDEWRALRLRPLCSRGDAAQLGNRHFRLSPDASLCTLRVYGTAVELRLATMRGNAGTILRLAAALAAARRINVTFRLDDTHLHVTIDPSDLPDHPERRRPVRVVPGRCVGVDLNPAWIGLAVAQNRGDPRSLADTALLDHRLVRLDFARDVSKETVRETLAAIADDAVRMARAYGAGTVAVEKGLGKLRSSTRNRGLNHLLNFWARTIFVAMLTRKARLAGVKVVEVWGGYSTTVGNLAFEAPDACASAAEIGRRGVAAAAGNKDVLPILDEAWLAGRRKDLPLRVEVRTWGDVHRSVKTAQATSRGRVGYRRPHPALPPGSDVHGRGATSVATPCGHAVRRLSLRHRPGLTFRPVVPPREATARSSCRTDTVRTRVASSTSQDE